MDSAVTKVAKITEPSDNWVGQALAVALELQGRGAISTELRARIDEARQVWSKVLFPTPKLEAWKYTDPRPIAQGSFSFEPCESDSKVAEELLTGTRIAGLNESSLVVFVDGVFSDRLSRVGDGVVSRALAGSEVSVGDLGQHRDDAFSALATALFSDCVCVKVAANQDQSAPIHVAHIVTEAGRERVITPRLKIEVERGARVTVVESHVGASGISYLSLPMVEISAADNAKVDYYKVQLESDKAYHVAGITARHGRDAEVRAHLFSFGAALARNNAQALLAGANGCGVLNGLSLLRGEQHVDNSTLIHHIEPHCESREHFKGIYAERARGVFSGTIMVDKIAQKTNAFQSNQALLLSSDASIESRPQLKIWADDVKCTHGATVGQLDDNALFYLRSRGLSKAAAQAFLVKAFASEVLGAVECEPIKAHIEGLISARLAEIV
jgi:Fe-S cluster assembly protein SufD